MKKQEPQSLTDKAKATLGNAQVMARNFENLVEAGSLLVLAAFGIWGALNLELRNEYKYVVLFSACVVGLRGAYEFLKQLGKK